MRQSKDGLYVYFDPRSTQQDRTCLMYRMEKKTGYVERLHATKGWRRNGRISKEFR